MGHFPVRYVSLPQGIVHGLTSSWAPGHHVFYHETTEDGPSVIWLVDPKPMTQNRRRIRAAAFGAKDLEKSGSAKNPKIPKSHCSKHETYETGAGIGAPTLAQHACSENLFICSWRIM